MASGAWLFLVGGVLCLVTQLTNEALWRSDCDQRPNIYFETSDDQKNDETLIWTNPPYTVFRAEFEFGTQLSPTSIQDPILTIFWKNNSCTTFYFEIKLQKIRFTKIDEQLIWTNPPRQFFAQNSNSEPKSAQLIHPGSDFGPFSKKYNCYYFFEILKCLTPRGEPMGPQGGP